MLSVTSIVTSFNAQVGNTLYIAVKMVMVDKQSIHVLFVVLHIYNKVDY